MITACQKLMDANQSETGSSKNRKPNEDKPTRECISVPLDHTEETYVGSSPGTPKTTLHVRALSLSQQQSQGEQMQDSTKRKTFDFLKKHELFHDITSIMPKLFKDFQEIYNPHKKDQKYLYRCALCNVMIYLKEEKESHMLKHIAENNTICENCTMDEQELINETPTTSGQIKTVIYRKDIDKVELDYNTIFELSSTIVYCGKCNSGFSRADILMRQLATKEILTPLQYTRQSKVMFLCDACGKEANNKSLLINHLLEHNAKRHFLCANCQQEENKLFLCLYKGSVRKKLSDMGGEAVNLELPIPVKCTMCQDYVDRPDLLIPKLIRVKFKPTHVYICIVCGENFLDKTGVTNHVQDHIRLENTIYCDNCIELILKIQWK